MVRTLRTRVSLARADARPSWVVLVRSSEHEASLSVWSARGAARREAPVLTRTLRAQSCESVAAAFTVIVHSFVRATAPGRPRTQEGEAVPSMQAPSVAAAVVGAGVGRGSDGRLAVSSLVGISRSQLGDGGALVRGAVRYRIAGGLYGAIAGEVSRVGASVDVGSSPRNMSILVGRGQRGLGAELSWRWDAERWWLEPGVGVGVYRHAHDTPLDGGMSDTSRHDIVAMSAQLAVGVRVHEGWAVRVVATARPLAATLAVADDTSSTHDASTVGFGLGAQWSPAW